ncbi:MAG TPA: MarC family protein [Steroidobacteraceae bacterium]|nr:MarC family protein [Steroidobacteraceae bacterium]
MFEQSLKFFVVFFVVVDPVSLIPLFTGLTAGASTQYKRRMAIKAVAISAAILLLFALGGAAFLQLMGISLEAFRIFGGLLLFLLALEMVFARESGTRTSSDEAAESRRRADISVFPLAFPFIAGPGALATILLWFGRVVLPAQAGLFAGLITAAALVLAIVLALLWVAEPLMRVIGVTGANVASRILGVILGALAVQFVLDGLRQAFAVS